MPKEKRKKDKKKSSEPKETSPVEAELTAPVESNEHDDRNAESTDKSTSIASTKERVEEGASTFAALGLDARLLKSLAKMGIEKPTLVQATAIPVALKGKDVLANARTGSGKTLAYLLPILQRILTTKKDSNIHAVVLVPTKELADQVDRTVLDLIKSCSKEVSCINLAAGEADVSIQKPLLATKPDVLIATPSRLVKHLDHLDLAQLQSLAIDEADLLLSFGYEDDLSRILDKVPRIYQAFLLSATVTSDVNRLKSLILRNPAILKLHEEEEEATLTEYVVKCESDEHRFLLLYFLLKLKVSPFGNARTIVYVNDVDSCYKLKLFLEQFGVRTCVLDASLPVKSRLHVIAEFNRGVYDIIIATDNGELDEKGSGRNEAAEDDDGKKKSRRKGKKDKESSSSRGLDFHKVAAVINFDVPETVRSYVHRLGRTARGGNSGHALTLVRGENPMMSTIETKMEKEGRFIKTYEFDWNLVEGFRYRVADALRAVTRASVREARIKEIKQELLNSEKLKSHFEDKIPVRHDKVLHPTRIQPHMKIVPKYLLPGQDATATKIGYVPYKVASKRKRPGKESARAQPGKKRKTDALSTFSYL